MVVISQLSRALRPRKSGGISSQRFSHLYNYVADLEKRQLLRNAYPTNAMTAFEAQMKQLPPVLYAGFDPTADSLHVGNLLVLVNLFRGAKFGLQPIALVGGFTATIGDPSGRDSERDEIDLDVVQRNSSLVTEQVRRIGENCLRGTGKDLILVDNDEWFGNMPARTFLRINKKFRVGEMLRMGAVKKRMSDDNGISYTEFSYQNLQAYDWGQLAERYNCLFQLGGSDQLGHLDHGAHYIKRSRNAFAAGVCLPLITDSAGNKIGKSVGGGSLWLSAARTSPFHFYQFFRQLHDTEAEELLMKYSLKPYEEVDDIIRNHRNALGKWVAQDALAGELTALVHGEEGLDTALRCTRAIFHGSIEDVRKLSRDELMSLFMGATQVRKADVSNIGDFADRTRTDKQKGHVLMTKGAFKVNGEKITDPTTEVDLAQLTLPNACDLTFICWGKRKFQLVQWI